MSVLQTLSARARLLFRKRPDAADVPARRALLDQRMRRRTRDYAINLSAMRADRAMKLVEDGEARETPIAAIRPGDLVIARPGERIAVDGDDRGRALGGRPEPGDRRDRAGRRCARRARSTRARSI